MAPTPTSAVIRLSSISSQVSSSSRSRESRAEQARPRTFCERASRARRPDQPAGRSAPGSRRGGPARGSCGGAQRQARRGLRLDHVRLVDGRAGAGCSSCRRPRQRGAGRQHHHPSVPSRVACPQADQEGGPRPSGATTGVRDQQWKREFPCPEYLQARETVQQVGSMSSTIQRPRELLLGPLLRRRRSPGVSDLCAWRPSRACRRRASARPPVSAGKRVLLRGWPPLRAGPGERGRPGAAQHLSCSLKQEPSLAAGAVVVPAQPHPDARARGEFRVAFGSCRYATGDGGGVWPASRRTRLRHSRFRAARDDCARCAGQLSVARSTPTS